MQDKKQPAIQVTGVHQTFDVGQSKVSVLKDANFTINEKTFTVLFGPSGSGKSTLLNILTGLQSPTEGQVVFDGQDVYQMSPDALAHFRASSIGFVYQQNFWVQSLNVIENVSMPLYFLGYPRLKATAKARKMLSVVGMTKAAHRNPQLLSSGEQQRVAMARAIISNPEFLVADEPTGSLDSANGDKIMELLRHSQEDLGRTVILVTHNMEYLPLADNLLHIHDGYVQQMPPNAINETTEALLKFMKERIDSLLKAKKQAVRA